MSLARRKIPALGRRRCRPAGHLARRYSADLSGGTGSHRCLNQREVVRFYPFPEASIALRPAFDGLKVSDHS